jgi:hypothetical protein
MNDEGRELILRMVREEMERLRNEPPAPPPPPKPARPTSVPYTELKEDHSNDPAAPGWNVYAREIGRLIAEGHEGKWVAIAEGRLIGVYATKSEADCALIVGKFTWPAALYQVRSQHPVPQYPLIGRFACRNSPSPST